MTNSSSSGGSGNSTNWVAITIAIIAAIGTIVGAIYGQQVVVNVFQQGQATGVAQLQPTIESLRKDPPSVTQVVQAVTTISQITAVTQVVAITQVIAVTQIVATPEPVIIVATPTIAPTPEEPFVTTINNITYTLIGASYNAGTYAFTFTANNQGADKEMCLFFNSYVAANDGKQYQQTGRSGGGNTYGLDCLFFTTPNNVPTQFALIFNNMPPNMTSIPLVQAVFRGEGNIQFRDVPIPYKRN